jgi:4-hydroxy-3-polyprenylbenzoate decarboxylase
MSYDFQDFRDYLAVLERKGLLVRVGRAINKDTELAALVRLQFRGLPESQRKAFLFDNVIDSRGRQFESKVAIGTFAASRAVYATALGADIADIPAVWARALGQPIEPVQVGSGPCQEVVLTGADVAAAGGVDAFPHPISTPGFDPAPFLTSPYWVSRDPQTGEYNVGTYRGMIKAPDRVGLQMDTPSQHIAIHLAKARRLRRPLEVAVMLGAVPAVGLASVQKVPYGVSEYGVAGGLMGRPLEVVPCQTVDLSVVAHAEIVIEGRIDPCRLEPEGPFGEASGYMGPRTSSPVLEVTAITHRRAPIVQAFISEFPPSESTLMRKIGFENVYRQFLQRSCNIDTVADVCFFEASTCNMMFVIQLQNARPGQAWQALYAASGYEPSMGKIIIAVDEDVRPDDLESVIWALSFRMQPAADVRVIGGKLPRLDPSADPEGTGACASAVLIDATRPRPYPPTSLPAADNMLAAQRIWAELGLPELNLKDPWHGYELGAWSQRSRTEAARALLGNYLQTGQELADQAVHLDDG